MVVHEDASQFFFECFGSVEESLLNLFFVGVAGWKGELVEISSNLLFQVTVLTILLTQYESFHAPYPQQQCCIYVFGCARIETPIHAYTCRNQNQMKF